MAITWGAYRDQIRRSVLNDVDVTQWQNNQIHDYIKWALDTFAAHTALTKEWILDADTNAALDTPYDLDTDTAFALPDDMYDSIDFEGQVAATVDGEVLYLDPLDKTQGIHPYSSTNTSVFWIWPSDTINLQAPIGADGSLFIRYFAYYDYPDYTEVEEEIPAMEAAVLAIPRWAEQPISFLVGSYALAALATQSANIDRWKEKDDSGNPEHNALRAQQEYMFKQYLNGIARYPTQDRVNYFRQFQRGY